jgi:ribonuclease P protein component
MEEKPLKFLMIKKRRDFVDLQKNSEFTLHSGSFLIPTKKVSEFYLDKNKQVDICRSGITVTKKINKKATVRNYAKRVTRELLRWGFFSGLLVAGVDYIVIIKKEFLQSKFDILKNEFKTALRRIKKYYNNL